MSTPLSFFRKHQKMLIIVIGGLLAVALVIPTALTYSLSSGAPKVDQTPDEVMVTIDGEELTVKQLDNIRYEEQFVSRVMALAVQQAFNVGGQPVQPMAGIPGIRIFPPSQQNPVGQAAPVPVDDASALQMHILRKKGKEIGITVNDKSVNDFIKKTIGNSFTLYNFEDGKDENGELSLGLVSRAQGGPNGYSPSEFFELLRQTLVAQKTATLLMNSGQVVTPAAAWTTFRDLNRSVSAELLPVKTEDYLDKAGEPTAAQVSELFKKYRSIQRNPYQNQIGFRQLDKIALSYFKADYNKFLEEEKKLVTQEQLEKYYEENKETFRKAQLPSATPESTGEEATDSETTDSETEKSEEEAESTEEKKSAAEEASTEEDASPESDKAEEKKEETAEDEDKSEATTENEDKPETTDSSLLNNKLETFPVALLQDEAEEKEEATEEKKEEAKAEPATEEKAEATDEKAESTEEKVEVADEKTEPTEDEAKEENATPEPPKVEYKSIEEVEDQIRNAIARPLAQEKVQNALNVIRDRLDSTYDKNKSQLYDEETKDKFAPYASLDLKKLAEDNGLEYGEMPLSDFYDAADDENIGEVSHTEYVRDPVRFFVPQTRRFIAEAFNNGAPVFKARVFPGSSSNSSVFSLQSATEQFVFFKTEQTEGFLPELDQVKDQVIAAWKQQEASKLAKEAAVKLAADAADKMSLTEVAEDESWVVVADGITYFNQLSMQQGQPQLGTISGVEDVGMKMMDSIFATAVGSTSVAVNAPESVYYVVKVTSEQQDTDQLRNSLLTQTIADLPPQIRNISSGRNGLVISGMVRDLLDEYDTVWVKNPRGFDE